MKNIKNRVRFWSEADICATQGESISNPFKSHIEIFESKDVLEIGPGWGRQFQQLSLLTSNYCVADICKKVLDRKIYKDIDTIVIKNYKQDLNRKFDIITFWYVIHHILSSELENFFDFLNRHLYVGGSVFFNCPSDTLNQENGSLKDIDGDGIKTTLHNVKHIENMLKKYGFKISHQSHEALAQNCYVFLAEKIGGSI